MRTAQQSLLICYRDRAGETGPSPVAVFTAPAPEGLPPYLPADNVVLLKEARRLVGGLPSVAESGAKPNVLHCEFTRTYPFSPDKVELTADALRHEMTLRGITPSGRSAEGCDTYACGMKGILSALYTLRNKRVVRKDKSSVAAVRTHGAADAMDWDEAMSLVARLREDDRYRDALLVGAGCFLGMRISDLLSLRWMDILNKDSFSIREQKTGKVRAFRVNPALSELVSEAWEAEGPGDEGLYVFRSWAREDEGHISRQRAWQILKEIKDSYGIRSAKTVSTHTLRKTFGRRVWLQECRKGRGEQALLLLCAVFGHSSVEITKRYLGIRQEEILSVYDSLDSISL